jgi:tellurite resistance protein TerC
VHPLQVPLWIWAATVAALIAAICADLIVSIRRPGPVRMRDAALWSAAAVALAVGFGTGLGLAGHPAASGQFFAGWLTEYSLSVDNLFVFVLLISRSAVPRELHSRVLLLGVALALLLRGIFIALGASALHRFGWLLYLFGAFLLFTAVRLMASTRPGRRSSDEGIPRVIQRFMPRLAQAGTASDAASGSGSGAGAGAGSGAGRAGVGRRPDGTAGVGRRPDGTAGRRLLSGRRLATPLVILVIAIAAADLAFALDSIPAIFGLTREPYLVFTANMFALLGLRHLYFLLGGLLSQLAHLAAGLAAILGFIGVKLITTALRESGVGQLGPVPVPHISTGLSLAVIAGVIVAVVITSLLAGRRLQPDSPAPLAGPRRPGLS